MVAEEENRKNGGLSKMEIGKCDAEAGAAFLLLLRDEVIEWLAGMAKWLEKLPSEFSTVAQFIDTRT